MNQIYLSDLTDQQWNLIKDLFPTTNHLGRPRRIAVRMIVNAIFYLQKTGCQWRMLPKDFPKWKTVHHYFRIWRIEGLWEAVYERLRQKERAAKGRQSQPRAGCLDSESVKTGRFCGEERGFDPGKKVVERKRHLLVDTEGLPVAVAVTAANVSDHAGAEKVLAQRGQRGEQLKKVWVDGTYTGANWQAEIKAQHGIELEEVKRVQGVKGWQLDNPKKLKISNLSWLATIGKQTDFGS